MTTATMEALPQNPTPIQKSRHKFRSEFLEGIKPVDSRQPIPDSLAREIVNELIKLELPKDALIGIYDAFLILSTHLKEAGFTNLVLLETNHDNLTPSQERYYYKVKRLCEKSGIKYYVPPMNNYNRCDMKFDAIIGNPPYQSSNGPGSQRGSGTNPLWWEISKISLKLLKKDGILSFITPINIVSGGDIFTELVLGKDREYDLKYVDFSANDHFNVGVPICRWIATNSKTAGNQISVSDGRTLDADNAFKITKDSKLDEILDALFRHPGEKLNFNVSNAFDYRAVAKHLKNQGLPEEWAKDIQLTKCETYCYPVNINGKVKYSRVKFKGNGTWRVFYPQLQQPTKITVDNEAEAAPSTFTMVFSNEDDAKRTYDYLTSPLYQWVIDQTRVSGRVTRIISNFPNAPIESVLTSEQISYIQSQL